MATPLRYVNGKPSTFIGKKKRHVPLLEEPEAVAPDPEAKHGTEYVPGQAHGGGAEHHPDE